MTSCTGSAGDDGDSSARWCSRAAELLDVVDDLKHRSTLPEPRELSDDVDLARRLVAEIEPLASESVADDVLALEDAIDVYGDAVEEAGYDLLAAQTEFSTEEQVALYELERDGIDDAIGRIGESLDACP